MKPAILISASLLMMTVSSSALATRCSVDDMEIIGQKAWITAKELGVTYRARIDTGATRTSLHATHINVVDGVEDWESNIGKQVMFNTENELGDTQHHQGKIVAVRSIQNSLGSENRYNVEMTFDHDGFSRTVEVNLRDRSRMSDKLLIGRDWLSCQYLVDVNQDPTSES
ncbi:RimK/LysX family protein [uncultured Vibrio sp.]|uniref:putative ATP-dependent zinc protease n=1 Tax=uncultured Vibrio sp. TaxID=114054 RepID=UPI0025FDD16A|nr:RimK/LysX family protein [uncultured Vibrio sp.]